MLQVHAGLQGERDRQTGAGAWTELLPQGLMQTRGAPPRGTRFSRDIGTGTGICNDIVLQNEVFYVTTEE